MARIIPERVVCSDSGGVAIEKTLVTRRAFLAGLAAQTAAPPPSLLLIMAEGMRWDAMSSERHPVVETPNLDELAKHGTRFRNAYTVAPACSPSRACAFTGRYADQIGVTANGYPANEGEIYLPSILKHYGWDTAIAGKLDLAPARFSFGFDQFWSNTGDGPTPELGRISDPGRKHETQWITDRSIEFLRGRKGKTEPWFLFTSYSRPDLTLSEPEEWATRYEAASMPALARIVPPGMDEGKLRKGMAVYYGAVAHVDSQIGRILGELDRLELADNTLVAFTSDHGDMLGDRRSMFANVMYEGSSHIPLIWRGPKGAKENRGKTVSKIVENTDLLPSILETLKIPLPEGVQGKSFLTLARGRDDRWKDTCFAQLDTAMVRTARYKFIDPSRDLSGTPELYDMRDDPGEEHNLAEDPKMRDFVQYARRELTAWRANRPKPVSIPGMTMPDYAAISAAERKQVIGKAASKGK